ncbi:prolyl 3-hydroxylase 1-like [Thrips palmi]|uniref:procollagen-proline 3-dioxygenase n=1 Tax=Thrips palmi TaxID=161013 RepID=A0A6P8XVU8_THRPL|nr:prolyl 3-hydroxylase 1-like [Thrips palmi]
MRLCIGLVKGAKGLALLCCVVVLLQLARAVDAEEHAVDDAQDAAVEEHVGSHQDATAVDALDDVDPANDADNAVDANDVDSLGEEDADDNPIGAQQAADAQDQDAADDNPQAAAAEDAQDAADTSPAPDTATTPSPAALSTPASVSSEPREPASNRSVAAWFRVGVEAYLSEDWKTCATALENAILEWQYFLRANIDCRLKCGQEARRQPPLFDKDIEHLQHAEELLRTTLCIMKCKRRAFHGRVTTDTIAASDQKAFRDLKAYEYLQLCYYQSLQFQKAASAVFTIISHDPSNDIMRQNLQYYLSMPEVDANKLENYESEPYVPLYLAGTDAYFSENYESAVSNLEESLHEFLNAVDRCRADCEGPFDQGWLPDFTPSITNHYVYCLKCKTKCHSKLSQMNGERYDDFLPLHYNYLQFSYFKLGRLKDACEAAATYLMFLPADEMMLENIAYYKALPKFKTSMLQPRTEAVDYIHRQTYEDALLKFVADEFIFPDLEEKDIPPSNEIREIGKKPPRKQTDPLHSAFSEQNISLENISEYKAQQNLLQEVKGNNTKPNIYPAASDMTSNLDEYLLSQVKSQELERLKKSSRRPLFNFQRESDLGGKKRFVVDGLANELECKQLVQFAKVNGVRGDGYDGNKTPHSPLEIFEGITLGQAALMVNFGLIELSTLKLFLSLSERGKNSIATYFNISNSDLHFSFTHLVCRSSVPGKSVNGSALSHKIHADNCWFPKEGRCVKTYPAYYWRDYSALLYLNDDFDGGEFIFSADPLGKLIQSSIKPNCGRLVGFSAGHENLHGVQGVKRGTRCALALWFTQDSTRSEWGRILTNR